jgi:PPOX class probable F420-dependent enzyme
LRDDETILLYSRPDKDELRNIAANPKVSLALDVTDIGRNIVRLEGTAGRAQDQPPANKDLAYLAKYTERMAAMFGAPEQFARLFSVALIITPARLHTWARGAGRPGSPAPRVQRRPRSQAPIRCRPPPDDRARAEADDLRARIHAAHARFDRSYSVGSLTLWNTSRAA